MPIADIINEIDAHLSRLCQARELLSGGMAKAAKKKLPRRKRKVLVRQVDPAFSTTRRSDKNKSRSKSSIDHPKGQKELGNAAAQVSSAAPLQASHTEQSTIVEPQPTTQQSVLITRLPSRRRFNPTRSVRHRTAKAVSGTNKDGVKPAIALAGRMDTKVVVVSAEQARREREQAAQPAVRRPSRPISSLSGKSAFEALFGDAGDRPKTSG